MAKIDGVVDSHLEETILRLPSFLREIERYHPTANTAMCEIFIRRTQDYQRVLQVFSSSFTQSGFAGTESLVQEIQRLLNVLENHGQHFEG